VNTAHNDERALSRVLHMTRQQRRALERKSAKRTPSKIFPTHFSESSFFARLEKRSIAYLGRQQLRLKRLLANCDRLVSEHGGPESVVARLVIQDRAVWERQLTLVHGVIVKRTKMPARRDARPLKVQRQKVKAEMEKKWS